jgi:hypothetical protein
MAALLPPYRQAMSSWPDRAAVERDVAEHQDKIRRRYLDSARCLLEVDVREYAKQLKTDMRKRRAGTKSLSD